MLNPNLSPHSDPDVLTRFQEALARAGLAPAGVVLWPRFARYYRELAHLPRKARRALVRRWRRSLGGIALLLALGQASALAATIAVDGTSCTLIDAITAANRDAPAGGCPAGSGTDTITLPAGSTQTLTSVNSNFYGSSYGPTGLQVTSAIVIDGNGSTIARAPAAPAFRILTVARTGNLTVEETTITGAAPRRTAPIPAAAAGYSTSTAAP